MLSKTNNPSSRRPFVLALCGIVVALVTGLASTVADAQTSSTAPAITSVTVAANTSSAGIYKIGDEISVVLRFDRTVRVTGSPYVVLDIGGTERNAEFDADGSRQASALSFVYVVAEGDEDTDGVQVDAGSVSLNGGSIKSTDGLRSAVLTHAAATPGSQHRVDGVRPTAEMLFESSAHLRTTGFLPLHEASHALVLFSEPVTGLEDDDFSVTNASVEEPIVETSADYARGRYWSVPITPTATGAVTVDLPEHAAVDAAGNSSSSAARLEKTAADPATVSVIAVSSSAVESDNASFRVVRDDDEGALNVQLSITTEGDYLAGTTSFGAMIGADASTHTITIAAEETSKTITFHLEDDDLDEAAGSIEVAIDKDPGVTNYVAGSANSSAHMTILDNDDPNYLFLIDLSALLGRTTWEGDNVRFYLRRARASDSITLRLRLTDSGDYLSSQQNHVLTDTGEFEITMAASQPTATLSFPTVNDRDAEDDGTLKLEILPVPESTGHVVAVGSQTVTIRDNDAPPTVTLAVARASLVEGQSTDYTLTRTHALGESTEATTVTVRVSETGSVLPQTTPYEVHLPIDNGEASTSAKLTTVDDGHAEASSDVTLQVVAAHDGPYLAGDPSETTITVADNEAATFGIAALAAQVTEGANAVFTITRTGSTFGQHTVNVQLGGHDKIMTAATKQRTTTDLDFASGQTTASLTLTTAADNVNEGDGVIHATLDYPEDSRNQYSFGSRTATIRVKDDDIPEVSLHIVSHTEELENDAGTWKGGIPERTVLRYETRCSGNYDYATRVIAALEHDHLFNHPQNPQYNHRGTVVMGCLIAAREMPITRERAYTGPLGGRITASIMSWDAALDSSSSSSSYALRSLRDRCGESDVSHCPRYTIGSPSSVEVEVYNLNPTMVIAAEKGAVTEGDPAKFIITRHWDHPTIFTTGVSVANTRVGYRITEAGGYVAEGDTGDAHGDYFTATVHRYTVEVATVDDDAWNGNGSVTMELLPDTFAAVNLGGTYELYETVDGITPAGQSSIRARVTIEDDESGPTLTVRDATANEGDGKVDFVVSVIPTSPAEVTVNWKASDDTALAGRDYTPSAGRLLFAARATARTISVPIIDNDRADGDRVFEVLLKKPVNATFGGSARRYFVQGTIRDDDLPTVKIQAKRARVKEGATVVFVVRRDGPTTAGLPVAVELTRDGTAIANGITGTIAAGQRSAELTVLAADTPVDDLTVGNPAESVFEARLTTAAAGGAWRPGDPSRATVTVYDDDAERGLDLRVIPKPAEYGALNQRLTVTFNVTNFGSGATANQLTVTTNRTPTIPCGSSVVAADDSVRCSASYAVKQTDVNAESILFTATATDGTTTSNVVNLVMPYRPAVTVMMDEKSVPRVGEDTGAVTVTASLSDISAQTVTVDYATATWTPTGDDEGLPATDGSDFTGRSGTLTFATGLTVQTITIDILPDDIHEPREKFWINLDKPRHARLGDASTLVTIRNNDGGLAARVSIAPTQTRKSEGAGKYVFAVRLDRPSGYQSTMYATTPAGLGTATVGVDYHDIGRELITFELGETVNYIRIPMIDDVLIENDETLAVVISDPKGAIIPAPDDPDNPMRTAYGTIADNEVRPFSSVDLSMSPLTFSEAAGGQTVKVTATVDVAPGDDTRVRITVNPVPQHLQSVAVAPDDYATIEDFDVIVAAESTTGSASFTFTPVDDNLHEGDETVEFIGRAIAEGGIVHSGIAVSTANVTIEDDDDPGITITPTSLRINEGESETFTVVLDWEPDVRLPLEFTAEDEEAVSVRPQIVAFTASNWDEARTITVYARTDADTEHERVRVRNEVKIGRYKGAVRGSTVNVRVHDTSIAEVSIDDVVTVGEGAGHVQFDVALSAAVGEEISIAYETSDGSATAGNDYVQASGTLTFAAGVVDKSITVTVTDDSLDEPTEDFLLELRRASGDVTFAGGAQDTSARVRILDNDARPILTILFATGDRVARVPEDAGSTQVKVTLTPESGRDVQVEYGLKELGALALARATAGVDFVLVEGTLTFAAGETAKNFEVEIVDDGVDETAESVAIELRNHVFGAWSEGEAQGRTGDQEVLSGKEVLLTIDDDDERRVIVTPTELSVGEGDSGGSEYTVGLGSRPTGDVTMSVSGHVNTELTVAPTRLTFTAANWITTQTVTVAAAQDAGAENEVITLSHSVTGADYGENSVTAEDVRVTVVDDDMRGVAVKPATFTIAEGGVGRYTLALETQPTERVRITVSEQSDALSVNPIRLSFSVADWEQAQTVTVTTVQDEDGADEAVSLRHAVAGGDYGENDVSAPSVLVTVDDDDTVAEDVSLLVSPTEIGEGDSGAEVKVTAKLNGGTRSAATPVSVAVGAGDDTATEGTDYATVAEVGLTIAANEVSATATFTLSPTDDRVAEGDETVTVSGTTTVNGLSVKGTTVTLEDDDERGVTVDPQELTVAEGGSVTYTVVLSSEPTAEVEVSVSRSGDGDVTVDRSSLTFTGADWGTAQMVLVSAAEDADAEAGTATLAHAVTSSGDYSGQVAASVTVTEVDNDAVSTEVALSVVPSAVSEGSSGEALVVTAALNGGARSAVTPVSVAVGAGDDTATEGTDYATVAEVGLTIAANEVSATATFTLSPTDDEVAEGDETVTVSGTTTVNGLSVKGTTVTLEDDDERGVTVDPQELTVAEGGSVTYTVVLSSEPTAEVEVSVSRSGDGDVTVDRSSLTFTGTDWGTAQTVRVSAAEDVDAEAGTATLAHGVTSSGDYSGQVVGSVTVTEVDNDAVSTEVALSVVPSAVSEGSSGEALVVTAALNGGTRSAATPVSVAVGAGDDTATEGTDYATVAEVGLTIAANEVSATATFTLSPTDDEVAEGDETVTVSGTTTVNGLSVKGTTVTLEDDEERGVTVDPQELTVAEGGSVTYTVVLSSEPTAEVEVSVSRSGDGDVTVDRSSLTFTGTDWGTAQTVLVSAAEDVDAEAGTATLAHAVTSSGDYSGQVVASVTVTEVDNDAVSTEVALSVVPSAVSEGSSGEALVVTAKLNGSTRSAATPVSVTVGAGDDTATEGTDYATVAEVGLTIAANEVSATATFTLSPTDDEVAEGDETVTVSGTTTVNGLSVKGTTVTLEDDDERGVTVDPQELTVAEGGSVTYTVVLSSEPTAEVEVSVSRSGDGDVTVDRSSLTFTGTDWGTAQTVLVSAAEDVDAEAGTATLAHAVTSSGDYSGQVVASVTVTEVDNDAVSTEVALSVVPSAVSEGSSGEALVVTAALNGGARSAVTPVSVTVGAADDTATEGTDYATVAEVGLTIAANEVSATATFTLSPTDDEVAEGDETVTVSGTTTVNGLSVKGTTVTLEDDEERGVTVDPQELTVAEGGSVTYTVVLSSEPTAEVEVSVSRSGDGDVTVDRSSLTFTGADWGTAQMVRVSAAEDVDAEAGTATLAHGVTSSGDYSGQVVGSVTVTERDNDAVSTEVALSVVPSAVSEGSSGEALVVTAALNGGTRSAATPVSVAVGAGDDTATEGTDYATVAEVGLTIAANEVSATATFTLSPTDDEVAEEDETVTVSGTTTADGLSVKGTTVTLEDDEERGVRVEPQELTVAEGGSVTYTVVLSSEPTAEVEVSVSRSGDGDVTVDRSSLTFTGADWGTAQMVRVSAAEDVDAEAGTATLAHGVTSSGDYSGEVVGSVTVTEVDNDAVSTEVALSVVPSAVSEGSSGEALVVTAALNGGARSAATPVSVTVGAADDTATEGTDYATVAEVGLTIAANEVSATATFTLSPTDDEVAEGDETVTVSGTTTVNGLSVKGTTVTLEDDEAIIIDDERGVTVDPQELTVAEGGSVTYTVVLSSEPTAEVEVSVSRSGDSDVTVDRSSLTFTGTDWGTAQTVLVSAAEDVDAEAGTATLAHGVTSSGDYSGQVAASVTVTEVDNDPVSTEVALSVVPSAVSEGSSGEALVVTAALNGGTRSAATPVSVAVGAGDDTATEGTDYATVAEVGLTIAANEVSGTATFTLSPTDDEVAEGDETVTVSGTTTADGLSVKGTTVTLEDDEERGVTVDPQELTVAEGGSVTYTVVLSSEPTAEVEVSVSRSGDSDVTVDRSSLTFTGVDWGTAQMVLVSAAEDVDAEAGTATLAHGVTSSGDYSGEVAASVTVTEVDNDPVSTEVALSVVPSAVSEGSSGEALVVTAALNGGARSAVTPVSVAVGAADDTATEGTDYATVAEVGLTIAANEFSGTATFTLSPTDDEVAEGDETVTVSGTTTVNGLSVKGTTVTLEDDDVARLTITDAQTMESSGQITFQIRLDRVSSRQITVRCISFDGTATAPEDYEGDDSIVTLEPGQTTTFVTLAVVDDAVDEHDEIFTLRLNEPANAQLADPTATGTIIDDDAALTRMWLSRFGRTVATEVLGAVDQRLTDSDADTSYATIANRRIEPASSPPEPAWPVAGGTFREVPLRELLAGSAFQVTSSEWRSAGDPAQDQGIVDRSTEGGWALWGRGGHTQFEGREQGLTLSGRVDMGIAGFDYDWGWMLAGVAVSHSVGRGEFALSAVGNRPGRHVEVTSSLTSVHPYVKLAPTDSVVIWGLLGYGLGSMKRADSDTATGIDMKLASFGARGALVAPAAARGLGLDLKSDGFLVLMKTQVRPGAIAVEADASRVRVLLDGALDVGLGSAGELKPSLGVGVRYDAGDAETGFGLEVNGGLGYVYRAWGLSAEARARVLLAHEDRDYREWGVNASLRLDPGTPGRGLSLGLSSSFGATASAMERLWSVGDAGELVLSGVTSADGRITSEASYAIEVFGADSVLTPSAGLTLDENGSPVYRVGGSLSHGTTLGINLEGSRVDTGSAEPTYNVTIGATVRW